jgi:hypothetical protein
MLRTAPTLHIVDVESNIMDEVTAGYWPRERSMAARLNDQVDSEEFVNSRDCRSGRVTGGCGEG